jgi:hypothetical protein
MNLPVATLPQNRRITPEKALHLFRASVASLPANAVYIFKFKILHIPPVFSPVVTYKSFFANHVGLKIATCVSNTVANARTGVRAGPSAQQEAKRCGGNGRQLGAATRVALINNSVATGQRLYSEHFPFPGIGKIVKTKDGTVWQPEVLH